MKEIKNACRIVVTDTYYWTDIMVVTLIVMGD
jgi:hypothetical protein